MHGQQNIKHNSEVMLYSPSACFVSEIIEIINIRFGNEVRN